MFTVQCVPIYDDNYVWIIHNADTAWVIDPGNHQPVIAFLQRHQLQLGGILLTHRHWDHVTGVQPLLDHFTPQMIPVYGPVSPTIRALITDVVHEGDRIELGPLRGQIWYTPGHTLDHISYYFAEQHWLFCGDTLFACGCGRLFDGSMEQLYESLQRIATLPLETLIYCTHEYTLANMDFALAVEPNNAELQQRQRECQQQRAEGQPTLPTRLDWELRTNPFLRSHLDEVKNRVQAATGNDVNNSFECFRALRTWKNGY
jgi:hydroxyacylglutathione hydrolase